MRSLRRLREQIVRANLLVQEACFIADELERHTEYKVTLQIPSDNLNANRKVSHRHTHKPRHLCKDVPCSVFSAAISLNICVSVCVEGCCAQ